MDNIKPRLGDYKYHFLLNLQNYLDTTLLFFGSIQRIDYFEGSSDIDIAVLTDNPTSMMSKIKHHLNISNSNITRIYQSFNNDKEHSLIRGYKMTYKDTERNWGFDIIIYDEKYKNSVLNEITITNNLPFYITWWFFIIKFLYYKLNVISKSLYYKMKQVIFNIIMDKQVATLSDFN
jgi:hypothetical protein